MIAGTSLRLTVRELLDLVNSLVPIIDREGQVIFNRVVRPLIILADAQSSYYTLKEGVDGSHSIRVAQIARKISQLLGLSEEDIVKVECSALFHDIGKILVERGLFLKRRKLTNKEYEKVKFHVSAGVSIICQFEHLRTIVNGVYDHHERWDGQGYPNNKAGERISLEGRILSLADVYDAITTPRPYRRPLGIEKAREEIEKNAGTQFDPEIACAFLSKL